MTLQFNPKQRLCFYVMAKQGELSGWMCIIFSWVFCVIVPAPAACNTVFVFMLPLLFYYLSPAVRCFRWLVDGFFITESRVKSEASQCGI